MIFLRNKNIVFFIYCVVTILSFQLNELSAQCDFKRGQIISFDVTDANSEAGYSDVYLLLDMAGTIVDFSENTVFRGRATGSYRIASINYMDNSVVNGIAIGQNEANISGTCFDISYSLPLNVCLESSCEFCEGDLISFSSNNGNMDSGYELIYLLVSTQGTIIDITADPSFSTVAIGNYSVVSLSYLSDASTSGIFVGGSIQSIMSDCMDFGNSIAFQVCENYTINVPSTIQKCSDETIVLTAGTNGDPDDLVWTDGINTYLGNGVEVLPTVNTQYTVSLNGDDCSEFHIINVFITDPIVTIASDNMALCIGEQAILEVEQIGLTYLWSNDETTRSITVAPMNTTTYTVTVTDNNSCTSSQEITIDVNFQDCELPCAAFTHEEIVLQVAGMNTDVEYETKYVLASIDGTILNIIDNPNFGQLPEGSYIIISLNYNLATGVTGLTLGNQLNQIIGDCLDISDPLIFDVCIKNTTCEEVENNNENICDILTANPSDILATLDCDGDGDTNAEECDNGTDPTDPCDSSNTTREDICLDIANNPTGALATSDCDGDGDTNAEECDNGTDPTDPCDSSNTTGSDICTAIANNPTGALATSDCDGDGDTNAEECNNGTDPTDPCDSSNTTGDDICTAIANNPTGALATADCDGDGDTNTEECNNGTDPTDPCDSSNTTGSDICTAIANNPTGDLATADCDGDGDTNTEECDNGTDPTDPCDSSNTTGSDICSAIANNPTGALATSDCDGDGDTNAEECDNGTDPTNPCDSSNTTGSDICTAIANNPTGDLATADCDGDGDTNTEECNNGTDPTDPCDSSNATGDDICAAIANNPTGALATVDCDGDGVINVTECTDGTDPMDPCSYDSSHITLNVTADQSGCGEEQNEVFGYVWKDTDGDGLQDNNESGIANVAVEVFDCSGILRYTALTNSEGIYTLIGFIPGNYIVNFDISGIGSDCEFTIINAGDDALDSDVIQNGSTVCTAINNITGDTQVDAGLIELSSLGDRVWHDVNGNGIQDNGEPGISGVVVNLYDYDNNPIGTTTTDGTGNYNFENLYPGIFYLEFIDPDGFDLTFANQGSDDTKDSNVTNEILSPNGSTTGLFILSAGEHNSTFDAGYYMCVPIGELVWYDIDEDDIHDSVENGINGLEVNLYRLEGGTYVLYDTQVTGHKPGTPSDDGYYKFCAAPGTYYVEVMMPPIGLVLAQANQVNSLPLTNTNESIVDSDMTNDFGNSTTTSFKLLSGEGLCNIGTGFYPMATLGNRVWFDDNQNGLQDDGEGSVANVKVEAVSETTGEVVKETVTNAEGVYELDYLQKESYYLRVTPPAEYGFTESNIGDDDMDSDIDHSNGANTTRTYSMKPGDLITNVDAGIAFVGAALPLTWVDVEARRLEVENEVTWITANEIDASHFIVERAYNQSLDFESIGRVEANNELGENRYSFIDEESENSGEYYYRIKQVDIDGRNGYSVVVYVNVENDINKMIVSPNPAADNAKLSIVLAIGAATDIAIFDRIGKLVRTYNLAYQNEGYSKSIEINDLPSGVYTIRLIQGQLEMTSKLIIVK